jgi:Divergent InlB B-repeat domain
MSPPRAVWAIAVVALLLVSGGVVAWTVSASPSATNPARSSGVHSLGGGPITGRFFETTPVPLVPRAETYCPTLACMNLTDDPSLNLTATGTLALAYTAYVNSTACAGDAAYGQVQVAVIRSTSLGATWSSPTYLGNPVCNGTSPTGYPDAWEPSLTSLSNGTLVLAYVEFNVSLGVPAPEVSFGPYVWDVPTDRLVVTELYPSASHWTIPTVIASGPNPTLSSGAYAPVRPSITATGNTVYLAWMGYAEEPSVNYSTFPYPQFGAALMSVELVNSTNGGASWGTASALPVQSAGPNTAAFNPSLLVAPNGTLWVAYATDVTYQSLVDCVGSNYNCAEFGGWTVSIVVGSSATNGSSFTWATAASGLLAAEPALGPWIDPAPTLAFSPSTGELALAYDASTPRGQGCGPYGCAPVLAERAVFVQNSSTGGATWSPPNLVGAGLFGAIGYPVFGANQTYDPSIAYDAAGVLHLSFSYLNLSDCAPTITPDEYCTDAQEYATSTNNGAAFSGMAAITANTTWSDGPGLLFDAPPSGEYSAMLIAGGHLWTAWTTAQCPSIASTGIPCPFPTAGAVSAVEVSTLASGPVNVSFTETGLPTGTPWSASVLGVTVSGTSTSLTLSGLPTGDNVTLYAETPIAQSYGTRYNASALSVSGPIVVSSNLSITLTYTEQYAVDVTTVPNFPTVGLEDDCFGGIPFAFDSPTCPTLNLNLTPEPGVHWVNASASFALGVGPVGPYCGIGAICYETDQENLTFYSWSGSGNGSISTTAANVTIPAVNAPINETASFGVINWCEYSYGLFGAPGYTCFPLDTTLVFQESGLSNGTGWNVTVTLNGTAEEYSSNNSTIAVTSSTLLAGPIPYTVWDVPSSSGHVYLPSENLVSPVQLPSERLVLVNYTRASTTSLTFPIHVNETGLPAGLEWGFNVSGVGYGAGAGNASALSLGGGAVTIAGSPVFVTNASAYVATGIEYAPYLAGVGPTNYSQASASVTIGGPALITITYAPVFAVDAIVDGPGTINASFPGISAVRAAGIANGDWVVPGQPYWLNATPAAGDLFDGWSGWGPGSGNSTNRNLSLTGQGAVTEVAVFSPPPSVTFSVEVFVLGIPSATPITLGLGNGSYSGAGTFNITGLTGGLYNWSSPDAYPTDVNLTRYAPIGFATSFTTIAGHLEINGDGTITVTYTTEVVADVTAGTGGSVTVSPAIPASGSDGVSGVWYVQNDVLTVNATPSPGYRFTGFVGTEPAGVTTTTAPLALTLSGPASEVASFMPVVVPLPATYSLTLHVGGLPSGLTWNATIGDRGISSDAASASIGDLNGTYTVAFGTLYASSNERFAEFPGPTSVPVTSNSSLFVNYTAQYAVDVVASGGGSVASSPSWSNASATITLSATSASGYHFVNWTGTGPGSYSGTDQNPTVTVSGAVSEVANFAANAAPAKPATAPNAAGPELEGIALLVVLLVVGVIVGMLLTRQRRAPPEEWAPASEEAPSSDASEPTDEPGPDAGPSSPPE